MARRNRGSDPILRLVLLAVGLLVAIAVLRNLESGGTDWVDRLVKDQGLVGEAIFIVIGIVATAVGVPRQGIAFLAGYAFGVPLGIALALAAQLGGGTVSFIWAREVGQDWAEDRLAGRFGARLRPLRLVIAERPFASILALRLVPIGNNLALNLLSGLAGLRFPPFIAASAIGYLPQTIIFVLLGSGLKLEEQTRLLVAGVLFFVSAGIGFWLLQRNRAAQVLTETDEDRTFR